MVGCRGISIYAFVSLERIGGWMCWDVSDAKNPVFQVCLVLSVLFVLWC